MKRANPHSMWATLTVLLCGSLAGLLSLLLGGTTRLVVPLMFLLVVISVAVFLGRRTAIIGSAVASLTFALLLFPPLYSLRVQDKEDQLALISFQAAAIALACLSDIQQASSD